MTPRTAFAGRTRVAPMSASEGRAAWMAFLAQARTYAVAALRGETFALDEARDFRGLAMHLTAPFPVRLACAEEAAAGALRFARGLMGAGLLQDRMSLAVCLMPALDFLDRVIDDDTRQRVDLDRRIAGIGD